MFFDIYKFIELTFKWSNDFQATICVFFDSCCGGVFCGTSSVGLVALHGRLQSAGLPGLPGCRAKGLKGPKADRWLRWLRWLDSSTNPLDICIHDWTCLQCFLSLHVKTTLKNYYYYIVFVLFVLRFLRPKWVNMCICKSGNDIICTCSVFTDLHSSSMHVVSYLLARVFVNYCMLVLRRIMQT